jgi:hypothetical protein
MNTRSIFAFVLSALVLGITILALLGIWDIIDWSYVQRYFWKSVQSLIIVLISSLVIYMINGLLVKPEAGGNRTSP